MGANNNNKNTTTAPLANGATFTGLAEEVSMYSSVVCAVKTDKAGTLYMEFSIDGDNWDSSLSFSVAAEVTLQPGEWVTLAAKATTGSPSYVTGSLNTREDQ